MNSRIVISIPIALNNRRAVAAALESRYGTDYVFIDRVFRSTITLDSCQIEICDRDDELVGAFELAGEISVTTLQQLESHQQIIYLTSTATGYDACQEMARSTQAILNIGGIAVRVESAGIAHEPAKWQANYDSNDVFDIYSLFVTLIEGDDYYYTCGMHNFGKADVAISLSEDIGLAIYVMNVFNYYRLTESPILQDEHTFKPDIESPTYRLKWIEDRDELDSLMHNPYGKWYLSRV